MNTSTLTSDARRNVVLMLNHALDGFKGKQSYSTGENGQSVLELTDVPVFRSGTFRDSGGYQHTWEPMHIDTMAMHFDLLKGRGVFANVPVRQGHPSFFGPDPILGLIGYHTVLRTEERVSPVDGQTYNYLLATYQIIDPTAAAKVEAGLYRSRSAEVGSFVGNNEAEYWPVYMGFAYVDIPAVEGLDSFARDRGAGVSFSIMNSDDKEAPVPGAAETNPPAAPTPTPPATPPATNPTPSGPAPVPSPPQVPDPEPQQQAPQHSASQSGPAFTFTIGGRQTTDFAAVQAHVTALETAQHAQQEAAREAFVDSLAHENKITAPQLDGTKAFAKGLTAEQFTAWQATWVVAPAVPLLQTHGRGAVGTGENPGVQTASATDELDVLQQTVKFMKDGGMTDAQLKTTKAYQRLQQLQSARPGA